MHCWLLLRSRLECLHTVRSWLLCNYWFLIMLTLSTWHLLCSLWICSVHDMPHRPILWPWIALLQSVLCLTRRAVEVFHVIMCGPIQQVPSLLPASVLRTVTHICYNASPDSSTNISSTNGQYPMKRQTLSPPSVTPTVIPTAYASIYTL